MRLITPEDGGKSSAVVIRSELVGHKYRNVALTCHHCVEDCDVFLMHVPYYDKNGKWMGYKVYPAHVYATNGKGGKDHSFDHAVLVFESDDKVACAKLAPFNYEPKFGESVTKLGFGLGDDCSMEDGKITGVATRVPRCYAGMIRTNTSLAVGDSGGPLFNTKHEVIALSSCYRYDMNTPFWNRTYFAPMSNFKTWDDGLNNALAFVYNRKEKMPVMAFSILKMNQYEVVGDKTNAVFCPACWNAEGH